MDIDSDTYKGFKQLLLGLPFWASDDEKRQELVKDALWGHPVLTGGAITWTRDGGSAATNVIEACAGSGLLTQHGKTPLCALLFEIRERGWVGGERAALVANLEQRLGCGARKPAWPHDPYPGLLALDQWQAPIFFGRTAETRELLRRLTTDQGKRVLLVTGASGSGKSSLVRAGVWAALAKGEAPNLPTSADWLITAMFPSEQGGDPFCALTNSLKQHPRLGWLYPGEEAEKLKSDPAAFADLLGRALAGLPESAEWLLILDQMEELFTPACAALRAPFLDLLLAASERPRFRVIATVRSDFLNQCVDHAGLVAVQNNGGQYGVRAPGPLAMTRMIAGPVEDLDLAAPVTLDPDLMTRLVDDAVSEPGGLALLAFALKDLYDQCRKEGCMDLTAYQSPSFGGLKGVIQRRADRALERAGQDGRAALPRVFSHLLTVQLDGTATRRREDKRQWTGDPAAEKLIAEFTHKDTRLLVVGPDDNPTVEVAHEALLREWPTLVKWIDDRREALRLRDRVEEETRTWVRRDRPTKLLWKHELLADRRRLLAEADLLADLECDPDTADFLIPEADWLLSELLCTVTDHPRRETIGMRLCEIGDPRPGVGLREDGLPDILWCEIPAGEVEIEEHGRFEVAPFHLAAYPMTYAQYKAFLEAADGYGSERWWDGLNREGPRRQLRPHVSYPADPVSWWEATAFCRWLSERLGMEVRLPDEWEWQWAGQSAQRDFVYPWGEERQEGLANTSETGIGRTTAVGMYPGGCSRQGVYDLSGNVWEWCRNDHDDPRRAKPGGSEHRVVRGGSWFHHRGRARARSRFDWVPDFDYASFGFRVLLSSPIR